MSDRSKPSLPLRHPSSTPGRLLDMFWTARLPTREESMNVPRCDVLIITALKEELNAFLDIGEGSDCFTVERDHDGFPVHNRLFERPSAVALEFAVAWSG